MATPVNDPRHGFCRDCLTLQKGPARRCDRCGSPRLARHDELYRLSLAHIDCDAFYAAVEKRDRPELFARYTPMTAAGEAADHAVAFDRGGVVAVATRLPTGLAARGGWGDTELLTPSGAMVDVLTGRRVQGGRVRLADLLDSYPVALLAPADVIEGNAS